MAAQPAKKSMTFLALAALGVVFGDIGTSPLYSFQTALWSLSNPSLARLQLQDYTRGLARGRIMTTRPEDLAPNLWLLPYPLKTLGVNIGRNVTIIRLNSGKLIVHSTAPFTSQDVEAIRKLGEPEWIVDSLLRHDTFATPGRAAFPSARYLAPEGFSKDLGFRTEPLIPPPAEWKEEVAVASVEGAPEFGEIVTLHRPTRTLVAADLIINFGGEQSLWAKFLLRIASVGGKHDPGMTVPFKKAIRDEAAFVASLKTILSWDFDRIVVGHGTPIPTGGKEILRATIRNAGVAGL